MEETLTTQARTPPALSQEPRAIHAKENGLSQTIRVGRYQVEKRCLDEMAAELRLYKQRKMRRDLLRAKLAEVDPSDHWGYRSPSFEGMPGAPGAIGRPTENRAILLVETQELVYLETWVKAVDSIRETHLDDLERLIIDEYVMVPPKKRQPLEQIVAGRGVERRAAYYRMNEALLEFALALIGEKVCTNSALTDPKAVVSF